MVTVEEFGGGVYFSRDTVDAMEAPRQMIPYPQSQFPKAICPNARPETLRSRVAGEVAALNPDSELDALDWIEGVADDIDAPACRLPLRFRPTYEKYEERPELLTQDLV